MSIFNRFKKSVLSENEITFMAYLDGKPISFEATYYWESEYHIKPKEVTKKLLNNNWLRIATFKESLNFYKAAELRDFLKSRNIKTSRKKDDLVASLLANFSEPELKKTFNQQFYIITEQGQYLRQKTDLAMTPELVIESKGLSADLKKSVEAQVSTYAKVKMEKLQKELNIHLINKDWGLYRNSLYDMSEIYKKRHDFKSQLTCLCAVCFIDLSGMANNNAVDPKSLAKLAPAVLYNLMGVRKKLKLNNEQVKKFYLQCVSKIKLPHNYHTTAESWNIIEKEYQKYAD